MFDDITVFPEMKTALRTYHPVPSLQKTDGNAQDAPRIKNCLKAAVLAHELKTASPSTPDEVIHKRVSTLFAPFFLFLGLPTTPTMNPNSWLAISFISDFCRVHGPADCL